MATKTEMPREMRCGLSSMVAEYGIEAVARELRLIKLTEAQEALARADEVATAALSGARLDTRLKDEKELRDYAAEAARWSRVLWDGLIGEGGD